MAKDESSEDVSGNEEEEEGSQEESSMESTSDSGRTMSWGDDGNGVARARRAHRKIKKQLSSGDEFYDDPRWQNTDSDESFCLESGEERSALHESMHSSWSSGFSSDDAASSDAKKRKPATKKPKTAPPARLFLTDYSRNPHTEKEKKDDDEDDDSSSSEQPRLVTTTCKALQVMLTTGTLRLGTPKTPWRVDKETVRGRPIVYHVKTGSDVAALGFKVNSIITHLGDQPVSWASDVPRLLDDLEKKVGGEEEFDVGLAPCEEWDLHDTSTTTESGDEDSASGAEGSDESAQGFPGKGKGKGKGKGGHVVCTKPAAKKSGPTCFPTYKTAMEWQKQKLARSEKLANDTEEVLLSIIERQKREEEKRSAQMNALKSKRRITGPVWSDLQTSKQEGLSLHKGPSTLLSRRGNLSIKTPCVHHPLVIRHNHEQDTTILLHASAPLRDPLTGIGYTTRQEYAILRRCAAIASLWLTAITHNSAPPDKDDIDEILTASHPPPVTVDPKIPLQMTQDGVPPARWRAIVAAFATEAVEALYCDRSLKRRRKG